jgi:hypothetical protein
VAAFGQRDSVAPFLFQPHAAFLVDTDCALAICRVLGDRLVRLFPRDEAGLARLAGAVDVVVGAMLAHPLPRDGQVTEAALLALMRDAGAMHALWHEHGNDFRPLARVLLTDRPVLGLAAHAVDRWLDRPLHCPVGSKGVPLCCPCWLPGSA